MSKQPFKKVLSMLIKDKDITSYQLLCACKLKYLLVRLSSEYGISFFFSLLFEKNRSVGRWETKHFIGMAKFSFLAIWPIDGKI